MTLDAIRKSILSDAESKAAVAESEARSEARRIVNEAEGRAGEIIRNAEREAEREAERIRREAEAGAEMEASAMLLRARGEAIERALKRVMARVESELSKNSMKRLLELGLKQFKEVSSGEILVRTSRKNAALLRGSRYEIEWGSIDGFIISTKDGKVALNATVGSVAGRQADVARRLIAEELFGKAGRAAPGAVTADRKRGSKPGAGKAKGRRRRG